MIEAIHFFSYCHLLMFLFCPINNHYIFVYLLREIKKVSDFGEVKGEKGEEKRKGGGGGRFGVFFSPLFLMDFMSFS